MHAIHWEISAEGFITGANVHDGSMVEFAYEGGGAVRIGIARTCGGASEFVFSGVTKLHANFVEGAIVYAVFAWKIGSVPEFSPEADDNPWRLLAWPAPDQDLTAFASRLSEDSPAGYLVQISCSYGGDVALICNEIVVCDRPEQPT